MNSNEVVRIPTTWDRRWMQQTKEYASYSKDRSRKVGSVIVNTDRNILVSSGWNGFPRGINDNIDSRHDRPAKYNWTECSERNAIYNAAAIGNATQGTTIYCSLFPCSNCARAIIQSGISCIVTHEPIWQDKTYEESFSVSRQMLCEAGVVVVFLKDNE